MTILYADGFELGTTLVEANTMSGNALTSNAFVNPTSTFTFGAASTGNGRSLTMAIFPNSIVTGNTVTINTPQIPNFLGASGAIGYTISFGFRAKLNSNKAALSCDFAIESVGSPGTSVFGFNSTTTQAASATLSFLMGTTNYGSIVVPDLLSHYYTLTAVKTAANVWTISVWLDGTLILNLPNSAATMSDGVTLFLVRSVGGTLTSQVNIFSEIDDMYITNTVPLGPIYVRRVSPASDVQAQWTKVGATSANYQAIDNISLTSANSLTAATTSTDIYGNTSTITSGKRIVAIKGSSVCTGTAGDTITENISVNGTNINSTATGLSALNVLISTGWNSTVPVPNLSQVTFGMTKN